MPETITGYNTFSAGTKARANQVNTNFSNHRGTSLPIDPNTATAAHLTYNLGSTEYRWDNAYLQTLDLIGATTTSNLVLERDPAATAGAFSVAIGGSTVSVYKASGVTNKKNIVLGTGNVGGVAFTASGSDLSGTSMSITVSGVGIVRLGLKPNGTSVFSAKVYNNTTTSQNPTFSITWMRDSTICSRSQLLNGVPLGYSGTVWAWGIPVSAFDATDFSATAGGHTYSLRCSVSGGEGFVNDYQSYAYED